MKSYSVYFANYTIGEDAYENVPQVCGHYGKRILLIGGEKAMEAGLGILEKAIQGTELEIVDKVVFGEDCTPGTIKRWADHARECEADMIFGMGGGKALDTAKGAADQTGLPVFTFPTIAATCAATTALSVVYKEDGNFDRFYFFDKPARHCFINTRVIADAPWRAWEILWENFSSAILLPEEINWTTALLWEEKSVTCVMGLCWNMGFRP